MIALVAMRVLIIHMELPVDGSPRARVYSRMLITINWFEKFKPVTRIFANW